MPDFGLHHLFEMNARERPDAVAIVTCHDQVSYRVLSARAQRLARWLDELDISAGDRVAVASRDAAWSLPAMIAIWRLGAVLVPLEPSDPIDKLSWVTSVANPAAILTDVVDRDHLQAGLRQRRILDIKESLSDERPLSRDPGTKLSGTLCDRSTALLLHSEVGSGRQAIIEIDHAALVDAANSVGCRLELRAGDTMLRISNTFWHLGGIDLMIGLASGMRLWPATCRSWTDVMRLDQIVVDSSANLITTTPRFWAILPCDNAQLATATCISHGEGLPRNVVTRLHTAARRLYYSYGVAEACWWTLLDKVREFDQLAMDAATGVPSVYLCDRQGRPIAPNSGRAGEIVIGGPGLASGYRDQPRQTAERFVPDPFGPQPGARAIQTGDYARCLANALQFWDGSTR